MPSEPIPVPNRTQVVAVGLLTEHDLAVLGQGFRRAYRLDEHHDFDDLLAAIDAADQRLWNSAQGGA